MKRFKICFEVVEPKLATVVSLLSGEVGALSITEIEDAKRVRGKMNTGGISPIRETRSGRAALTLIHETPGNITIAQLKKAMKLQGFAEGTAAAVMNKLAAEGDIKRVSPGVYCV